MLHSHLVDNWVGPGFCIDKNNNMAKGSDSMYPSVVNTMGTLEMWHWLYGSGG